MDRPDSAAVGSWAEMLGASRRAKDVLSSSALYAPAKSGHTTDGSRAPAGLRISPGMVNEDRQLPTDRYNVWE